MTHKQPIDLGNRIHLIDGFDLGWESRTGTYVIREEMLTLVETSASPSIPYVLQGLADLGIKPEDVRYIIVTHIHLDHSGGAGLLLQHCPNAQVVVHPKGARHLMNPERLIESAKMVYGEQFDSLFAPILPVPEEKVIVMADRETLSIGPACTLQFFDTPGHANHHFSIYDPISNGLFTGDTCGIKYPQTEDAGFTLYLPTTSPNQFNPDAMLKSMELIKELGIGRIYFGHFGMSTAVETVYEQVRQWLDVFVDTAREAVDAGKGQKEIAAALFEKIKQALTEKGVPDGHRIYEILQLDLDVCAMGLALYQKQIRS